MDRNERLAAWVTLVQAHAAVVDALERRLETERGISLSGFEVLLRLGMAPEGRLRMADLARQLVLSKSGVTRLIDRLQDTGLVRREASEDDRRVTWAMLTPAGEEMLRAAMPVHLRAVEDHFANHLSPEEITVLRTGLRRVLGANGQPDDACHSPSDFSGVTQPAGETTRS